MSAGATRYVYFVTSAGKTKVGVAERPLDRLGQLRCGSPCPVELVHYAPGDVGLERAVHALLDARHSHSEWFEGEVTKEEAEALLEEAAQCLRPRARIPRQPRTPSATPLKDLVYAAQSALTLLRSRPDGADEIAERIMASRDFTRLPETLQHEIASYRNL